MQLLIVLVLLLLGGKSSQNMLEEVKPVLENLGVEEINDVLKSAEEISSVLSVVSSLTSSAATFAQSSPEPAPAQNSAVAFPLKPISAIADRDIAYSLSRYISEN